MLVPHRYALTSNYNRATHYSQEIALQTVWATVHNGKIELLEATELPEGIQILVTLLSDNDANNFWLQASQPSLDAIWDNDKDDIYAGLS